MDYKASQKNKVSRGKIPASVHDSLVKTHPEIAQQWHPKLNGGRKPSEFMHGSTFEAWWQCPISISHTFKTSILLRSKSTAPGKGCPFCSGAVSSLPEGVSPRRSDLPLSLTHPELAKQWDYDLNEITPDFVSFGSRYLAHWICPEGENHLFSKEVYKRVRSRTAHLGCPHCYLASKKWQSAGPGYWDELPDWLLKEWDYKLNENRPNDYHQGARDSVHWRCRMGPDHKWVAPIYTRVRGTRCPFCIGQRVSVTNSLATLFPELAKEWSDENDFGPDDVTSKTDKYAWWRCSSNRSHHWRTKILNRTINGSRCPYCPRVKSFRNSKIDYLSLASQIDAKKNHGFKKPDLKKFELKVKFVWTCKKGHDRVQSIAMRITDGCPACPKRGRKR